MSYVYKLISVVRPKHCNAKFATPFIFYQKCCYNAGRDSHPANIYLFKIAVETLDEGVKYVESQQDTRTKSLMSLWCLHC